MEVQEEIGLLKSRVAVLEEQMPKVGRLIEDSNEYTLCLLFRHVICQPVEPGKRARLVVEQTKDGAGRVYLDHLDVSDVEDARGMR